MNERLTLALQDIKDGVPIIIVDDFDRENEGDLMIAGEKSTISNIAFMCRYGRGIMCLPMNGDLLDKLEIPMMVQNNTDPLDTPFTVSIDAKEGVSTGISASDRVNTIRAVTNPYAVAEDLTRPGHLFPLRARLNLLNDRRGHTEATLTLLRMLKMLPVGVISEMMNDDGTMARLPDLEMFAQEYKLSILSIADIVEESK